MNKKQKEEFKRMSGVSWYVIMIILLAILGYALLTPSEVPEPKINQFNIGYFELRTNDTTLIIKDLSINAEGFENLVRDLEPEVIYEDLYMNIDDWGKENATIYTKDEWLK